MLKIKHIVIEMLSAFEGLISSLNKTKEGIFEVEDTMK